MQSYVETYADKIFDMLGQGMSKRQIAKELGIPKSSLSDWIRGSDKVSFEEKEKPFKALVLDIEVAPIMADIWSVWQNGVGLNQVKKDWHLLSFAAKWYGEEEVFYYDQSEAPDIEDDYFLCLHLHDLLNQASATITQNGRKFDLKKINSRFILNGLPPVRPSRVIDTLEIMKREFAMTSNKLEYTTDKLCKKYKKLKHKKFPGHELWVEVMKGNPEAWAEMKEYNIQDVRATEELYDIIKPYSTKHPNIALMQGNDKPTCRVCGSTHLEKDGDWHTSLSVYDLYRCTDCGAYSRGRKTNTTKEQRANVTMATIS